jgi:hypothetical protein
MFVFSFLFFRSISTFVDGARNDLGHLFFGACLAAPNQPEEEEEGGIVSDFSATTFGKLAIMTMSPQRHTLA